MLSCCNKRVHTSKVAFNWNKVWLYLWSLRSFFLKITRGQISLYPISGELFQRLNRLSFRNLYENALYCWKAIKDRKSSAKTLESLLGVNMWGLHETVLISNLCRVWKMYASQCFSFETNNYWLLSAGIWVLILANIL